MNITLVFELTSDIHWMKDVVQFPLAIAKFFNGEANIIARPNTFQEEVKKHIKITFYGDILNYDYNDIQLLKYDPKWYISACRIASRQTDLLILYPYFGNSFKGSIIYKILRWLRLKKGKVILKTDGYLKHIVEQKYSLLKGVLLVTKFAFIDKIICENEEYYKILKENKNPLIQKIIYIPNCPLDIYHNQNLLDYDLRPNIFSFVGRIDSKEKGVEQLITTWIKICDEIPEWNLHLIGKSSEEFKNHWNKILEKNNKRNRVSWIPYLTPFELIKKLNETKIVVCSSEWENAPLILSEAVLSGTAFIGPNVGELPSALAGLPGLVNNIKELGKEMLLFANNPKIAKNQSKILMERFSNRKWIEQVKKLTF